MHSARDEVEYAEWLERIDTAAESLGLDEETRSYARDIFLNSIPEQDRSKRARMAASLYAGALLAGDERSQTAVAEEFGVSRHTVQSRWKDLLSTAGFDTPGW